MERRCVPCRRRLAHRPRGRIRPRCAATRRVRAHRRRDGRLRRARARPPQRGRLRREVAPNLGRARPRPERARIRRQQPRSLPRGTLRQRPGLDALRGPVASWRMPSFDAYSNRDADAKRAVVRLCPVRYVAASGALPGHGRPAGAAAPADESGGRPRMELGIAFPSWIEAWRDCEVAEAMGFTHAWFYDTQLLCSDVYATMALAAEHTKTMK